MITEKINQIEKLVTVPSAEIDPDGASNAMQILIHLTELRDLVDSAFLPPVSEIDLLMEFDVWISARFKQEYKIEESKEIMQKFLSSR